MDSLFADFMAVMGRFFEERLTKLADERAALVVPKAREGLAAQGAVEALTKDVADLKVSLPAAVKPLVTKAALAEAVEPLATKAAVDAAKAAAVRDATNGRPNWTETNKRLAELLAPLTARITELEAKLAALTPPSSGA